MIYELIYTRRAVKDIQVLDRLTQKRLAKKLEEFKKDPLRFSEKLIHAKLGQFRFRIGDYRIIYDLMGSKIVILRVGHRREIYR